MRERQKVRRTNGGGSNGVEPSRSDKPNNVIAFPAHVSRQRAIGIALARMLSATDEAPNRVGKGAPSDEVVAFPTSRNRQIEMADDQFRRAMQDLSDGLTALNALISNRPDTSALRKCGESIDQSPGRDAASGNLVALPTEHCRNRAVEYHLTNVADGLEQIRSCRRALEVIAQDAHRAAHRA